MLQARALIKHAKRKAQQEIKALTERDMSYDDFRLACGAIDKEEMDRIASIKESARARAEAQGDLSEEERDEEGEEEEDEEGEEEEEEGEIKIVREKGKGKEKKEGEKKKEGEGRGKKMGGRKIGETEQFDLRSPREERPKLQPLHIKVGGGYWLRARNVSFVTESTSGSYDALSITRDRTPKQKSDKDNEINMSIRLLPNFTTAVKTLAEALEKQKSPSIEEVIRDSESSEKDMLDFTQYSSFCAPRMKFLIDALHEIEGEEVHFEGQKGDAMQAISIRKLPKENAKKGAVPFKLNIPLRFLKGLSLAAEYMSAMRGSPVPK